MVALVIVLVCGFSSDYHNERPKHIMAMAAMSTVSLIIVATVEHPKVRYAFLALGASSLNIPLSCTWQTLIPRRCCWDLVLQSVDTQLSVQHHLSTC